MTGWLGVITTVLSLFLAVVWTVAAIAKTVTSSGTAAAALQLGVPAKLAPLAPVLLPIVEIGLATGLVVPSSRTAAACASALLLGLFSVLVIRALARGDQSSCHCFGALSNADLSLGTVARNVLLLCVSLAIVAGGSVDGLSMPQGWAVVGMLAVLALVMVSAMSASLLWLVVRLVRQQGQMVERVDTLERLARAEGWESSPDPHYQFNAQTVLADSVSGSGSRLADLLPRVGNTAVIMLSVNCGPCRDILARRLEEWARLCETHLNMLVLVEASSDNSEFLESEGTPRRIFVEVGTVQRLGLPGTPAAVIVTSGGGSLTGPHFGADAIENALVQARALVPS